MRQTDRRNTNNTVEFWRVATDVVQSGISRSGTSGERESLVYANLFSSVFLVPADSLLQRTMSFFHGYMVRHTQCSIVFEDLFKFTIHVL